MEEKKKSNSIIIIILVLIIIAALGVIAYILINDGVFDKKDNNEKIENKQNETEEVVKDTMKYSKSKNINILGDLANIYIDKDGKVFIKNLKIGDVKAINNITEKAKYITSMHHCGGNYSTLILTEDGNLYLNKEDFENTDEDIINDNVISSYQKIVTNYKFKEIITINDPNPNSTCGLEALYALTTTNELRNIYVDYASKNIIVSYKREEKYPFKFYIGMYELGNLLFFYKDGSVKLGSQPDGLTGEYSIFDKFIVDENNKIIKISKAFYRINPTTDKNISLYLITKDNKILKVSIYKEFTKDTKLVAYSHNSKIVDKVSYTDVDIQNDHNKKKITITYTDKTEENFDTDSTLTYDSYDYREI